MKRQLAMCGLVAGVVGITSAHADTIHWFWEVEVNGIGVDTSRPVVVEEGDQVDIELWAQFDPYGEGFAYSLFALAPGDEFFSVGDVNVNEADGYGRNEALRHLGGPGTLVDTGGATGPDFIDAIEAFQPPKFFNSIGDWRNPLPVYRIGWSVSSELNHLVTLERVERLDGLLLSHVYVDIFGVSQQYAETSDAVRFVPSPPGIVLALAPLCLAFRRRKRQLTG